MFHDEDNSVPEKKDYVKLKIEIRDALKDASFRKVLTQILLDLQKDVAGDTRKKLNELYRQLDLHHDAYKKLNDWRWYVVSQGIIELTQMQVVDSFNFITKFINDRRGIIRKQAEIATVSLKPEGISYFLDTTKFSISEWQQLKLMEVLRVMEHFRPPSFKTWLVSGNRDVVLFALRLIRHYNQNDAAASIIELVKHKNERIKLEAILCIKEFCLITALDTLKAVFPKTGQATKIEILDTIATLGNEEDLEFLKKVEQSSSSFLVKNKAQMAINDIAPETFIPSKGILSQKELEASELAQEQHEHFITEEIGKIAAESKTTAIAPESVPEMNQELEVLSVEEPIQEQEDIEVFQIDLDTIEVDEDPEPKTPFENEEKNEPSFEIGVLDKALDSSINAQIGLLNNVEADVDMLPHEDLPEAAHYFDLSPEERLTFIALLEESATEKEIGLLEEVMQKEEDSEIRYRLFNILRAIQNKESGSENIETETTAIDSVFHSLFEYASDLDSKLILLREISEVGDEKEFPLLELLENDANPMVRQQAKKSKEALIERLYEVNSPKVTTDNTAVEEVSENFEEPIVDQETDPSENRLPLELCFLEEIGIGVERKSEPEIAFELTEEFYEEQEKRISLGE